MESRSAGLAEASLVVLADRLGTVRIATLDERHFRAVRLLSGAGAFHVLPKDGGPSPGTQHLPRVRTRRLTFLQNRLRCRQAVSLRSPGPWCDRTPPSSVSAVFSACPPALGPAWSPGLFLGDLDQAAKTGPADHPFDHRR